VTFDGCPWPAGARSVAICALTTFTRAGSFAQAIASVQACATDPIHLVGHSSGCAIANAVDRGLKGTGKVILAADLNGGAAVRTENDLPTFPK